MKLRTIHEFQMLRRIWHFLEERPELSAKPRIAELTAELHTAITATQTAAWHQVRGFGQTAGSTVTRREKHQQLRAYLKDLARVARSLNHDTFPGIAAHFLLPTTRSYNALIVTARTMIKVATDLEAILIAHGLPETFLTDLTTLVEAFTTATDAKIDGLQTQVAGTSGLKFHASQGVKTAQRLDAILRAHFRNDPITLEVWHHARHIQVDPKPSAEVPTPPSPSIDEPISSKIDTTIQAPPLRPELSLLSRSITENAHPPTKTDFTLDLNPPKKSHLTLESSHPESPTHEPHSRC
jgi:hypothetical protein